MVNRVPGVPGDADSLRDDRLVVGVDPGRIGPLGLRDRRFDEGSGSVSVVPGRAGDAGQLEGSALRPGRGRQLGDEGGFGGDEPDGSFVVAVVVGAASGSCAFS
jgi:hypothetical protein